MGATLEDVAGTIHAHPTLGEAVQEAALRALGHAALGALNIEPKMAILLKGNLDE
jgi:hypothetical protein